MSRRRDLWGLPSMILLLLVGCCCCHAAVPPRPFVSTPRLLQRIHPGIQQQQQRLYSSVLLDVRGGASSLMDDEDEEYDEEEYEDALEEEEEEELDDDDEDEEFDDDDSMLGDSDFSDPNMFDRFFVALKKTPPVTKVYMTASFSIAMYSYLFNANKFPALLSLDWEKVFYRLQLWRPFTAFLNFGAMGLGYLLTAQFVWHYMSTLERLNHKRPYEYWIMLLFGQCTMLAGYPLLKLKPQILGHNLSTFLVYIWSKYHEGIEVNMFELFLVKAEYLPWIMMAQTSLLEGEPPTLDFLGIVFGHLYHHCKTIGMLRPPSWVRKWYETSATAQPIRKLYQPIASEFEVVVEEPQ